MTSTRRSPPATSGCTSAARTSTRTWSQASNIDPSIYGVTTIPLAKNKTAGVLGGGTLVGVRPDANAAARAAAVKWIDFYYERPLVDKPQAIRNAKTLVASKQPVGVPALPIFNKAQYDLANTWIKPYINVPQAQMKPFTHRHLQPAADPGAGRIDAERLPLARRRGGGGPDRQERQHPAAAPAGEQHRSGPDQPGQVSSARPSGGRAPPAARPEPPADVCMATTEPVTPTSTGPRACRLTRPADVGCGARRSPGCAAAASRPCSSCCRCCSSSGRSRGTRSCAR